MLDQGLVSIATTMLAVIGTIAGTIVGVTLTSRSTKKEDKRKRLNEKVEEIYGLTNQVRDWAETWLLRLAYATGVNAFECVADYTRPVLTQEDEANLHFWTLVTDPHENTCPIDKIVTLISLHLRPLKELVLDYRACVFFIENNLALSMTLDKLIEGKTPVNADPAAREQLEIIVEEITTLDKAAMIRQAFNEFRKAHIALQLSLEKAIANG